MGIPIADASMALKREVEQDGHGEPTAQRMRIEHAESTDNKYEFDVSGIFSQPRVCEVARARGLEAGPVLMWPMLIR